MDRILRKRDALISLIQAQGPMAVAFSGGVDSTFLLAVARQVLGEASIAVTAHTPLMTDREKRFAAETAASLSIRQLVVFPDAMASAEFIANPPHRCYICKKMVFTAIREKAAAEGFQQLAHGANKDDVTDYRPGMRAAEELGVIAPLLAANLGKKDIRQLSREMALPTWDHPAMSCLASRVPYGVSITPIVLTMIEQAEESLRSIGIGQCRVRAHGTLARIEVDPSMFEKLVATDIRKHLVQQLRDIGFDYVALDLEGYAAGRMNRVLPELPGER